MNLNMLIMIAIQIRFIYSRGTWCPNGYYDAGRQCYNCKTGCDDCTKSNDCQKCFDGYYLQSNTCYTCNNCQTCSSSTVCTSCQSYQVLISQQCQNCQLPCVTCSNSSTTYCTICNDILYQTTPTCQCKTGYYMVTSTKKCTACVSPCTSCTSASVCQSCLTQYVLMSSACQPCTKPCKTCQINQTTCQTCMDTTNQTIPSCSCPTGYMMNTSYTCNKCTFPCATCQNAVTQCLTCASTYTYNSTSKTCNCLSNQFEQIGTPNQCVNCNSLCLTCSTISTRCTTCDASLNKVLFNSNCVCNDGYYDNAGTCLLCDPLCEACISSATTCICRLGKVSISNTCLPCTPPCESCSTTQTHCDTCVDVNQIITASFQCVCKNGYYASGIICLQCQSTCTSCNNVTGVCSACSDPNHTIINNLCVCKSGFIESGNNLEQCASCKYPCQECSQEDYLCTSCVNLNLFYLNGQKCVCNDGYYMIEDECFRCSPQCSTCEDFADNCTSCSIINYVSILNNCQCDYGFYFDSQFNCYECQIPCLTCLGNQDLCTQCISENHRLENSQCICNDGYYFDTDDCLQCEENCLICNDIDDCTYCQDEYFNNSGVCEECIFPCKNCSNESICLDCQNGFQLTTSGNCEICTQYCYLCLNDTECDICDDGYYLFESNCLKCDQNCLLCEINSLNCILCRDEQDLNENNQCVCKDGYYEENLTCLKCQQTCSKCKSLDVCLECKSLSNLSLITEFNKCVCDVGYLWSQNQCLQCNQTCLTCADSSNQCTSCDSIKFRIQKLQTCVCYNNYYEDQNKNCIACSSNEGKQNKICKFKDCTDKVWTYGEECDDGNEIVKDGCTNCVVDVNYTCINNILQPSKCYQCQPNCIKCSLDELINKVKCEQCNKGYYIDQDFSCNKCAMECLECSNLPKNCTVCRFKPEIPNKCTLCDTNQGYYINEDSTKCISKCGDQIKTKEEECDDGNIILGDGCDNKCLLEPKSLCKDGICIIPNYPKPYINAKGDQSMYYNIREFEIGYDQNLQINKNFSISDFVVFFIKKDFVERPIDYVYKMEQNITQIAEYNSDFKTVIQIILNSSSDNEEFILKFKDQTKIRSYEGFSQQEILISATIAPFVLIDESTISQVQAISSSNSYMLYLIGVMAGGALLFGGLDIFYNLLDSLQMLSYFKYVNTQFPYNLQSFFDLFGFAQINFVQKYVDFETMFDSEVKPQQLKSIPIKIANDGINELFLINGSSVFCVWLSLFGFYFVSLIAYQNIMKYKVSLHRETVIENERNFEIKFKLYLLGVKLFFINMTQTIIQEIFYNGMIRTHISTAYDYSFSSVLQLYAFDLNQNSFILNNSSILALLASILYFLSIYLMIPIQNLKMIDLKNQSMEKKFGSLFEGIKFKRFTKYYNSIQLIKKFTFMVILIFTYNQPLIQIMNLIILSIVMNLYNYIFKPLKNKLEQFKQNVVEISTLMVVILMSIFIIDDQFLYFSYEIRQNIGWVCIVVISLMLLISIFIDAIQQWIMLVKKYKKLKVLVQKVSKFLGLQKNQNASHQILQPCYDQILLYE